MSFYVILRYISITDAISELCEKQFICEKFEDIFNFAFLTFIREWINIYLLNFSLSYFDSTQRCKFLHED